MGGRQAAERRDVVAILTLGDAGHAADRLVERFAGKVARRTRVNLVIDVGDVAGVDDVIRAIELAKQAKQRVEHDRRPRVANMGEIVDRGPQTYMRTALASTGRNASLLRVSVL